MLGSFFCLLSSGKFYHRLKGCLLILSVMISNCMVDTTWLQYREISCVVTLQINFKTHQKVENNDFDRKLPTPNKAS